jgi:hypothetical protein
MFCVPEFPPKGQFSFELAISALSAAIVLPPQGGDRIKRERHQRKRKANEGRRSESTPNRRQALLVGRLEQCETDDH